MMPNNKMLIITVHRGGEGGGMREEEDNKTHVLLLSEIKDARLCVENDNGSISSVIPTVKSLSSLKMPTTDTGWGRTPSN